jgi:hypothetical protein
MNLMELWNVHSLHEERKVHIDNEDGSLVYGWKTDLEDEEGPRYLPNGYSKKVLELGGIFANEPGKGQGDRLMKLFLASPEAQAAERAESRHQPWQRQNGRAAARNAAKVLRTVRLSITDKEHRPHVAGEEG